MDWNESGRVSKLKPVDGDKKQVSAPAPKTERRVASAH
jgi:hypothetical protein